MSEVTQILKALEEGHSQAAEELSLLVYDELRRLLDQDERHPSYELNRKRASISPAC